MAKAEKDTFPLLSHADKLVEELRTNVPKVISDWDEDAIHDARVATRRLKAVMHVLKPVVSADHRNPFNDVLRKVRHRLGALRDIDVMLSHLDSMAGGRLEPAVLSLTDRLKAQRDDARKSAVKKLVPSKILSRLGMWWGVREELAECHEAVDTLLAESLHLQLDEFAERANGLMADRTDASEKSQPNDPHQVRITGKALRYTLEMAVVEGHAMPAAVKRAFKQMQDALGDWHDYVVLAECAMQLSLDELLPYHNAPLQLLVIDLAKKSVQKSVRHLHHFSLLWDKSGQELTKTIRESFPLTRAVNHPNDVSESQTDHDLFDSIEEPISEASTPGEPSPA